MDFPPGSFYVHFSIGLVCILFRRTGCPCAAFTLLRVPLVVMLLPQFPHCIPPFCGLYSLLLWIIAVFLEPRGLYASERSIYPLANVFTQKLLLTPEPWGITCWIAITTVRIQEISATWLGSRLDMVSRLFWL